MADGSERYGGICECGDHAWARLTRGYVTMVSPCDAGELRDHLWSAHVAKKLAYAIRTELLGSRHRTRMLHLHRVLLVAERGQMVDHANHNGCDNRRRNIRTCNRMDNARNMRRAIRPQIGFRGIKKHRRRWSAEICVATKRIYIGNFTSPEAAARAYDRAATEYFGPFAITNQSMGLL